MRNPTYAGEYKTDPRPEKVVAILFMEPWTTGPTLTAGIKTLTHTRNGLKVVPHEVVAIEIADGPEVMSFDMPPNCAREYAKRLMEFADAIESKKAS